MDSWIFCRPAGCEPAAGRAVDGSQRGRRKVGAPSFKKLETLGWSTQETAETGGRWASFTASEYPGQISPNTDVKRGDFPTELVASCEQQGHLTRTGPG